MMLMLADGLEQLIDSPLPVIAMGSIIAVVAILSGCTRRIVTARSREQTRRELAAYVAEGTMDADKAIEMLKAGEKDAGCCK